uniref:Uncharacterized protein n=1 Tax=Rhizophora mucronata TaxID=61149 RepID=A0A2P2NCH1_RHIMU
MSNLECLVLAKTYVSTSISTENQNSVQNCL